MIESTKIRAMKITEEGASDMQPNPLVYGTEKKLGQ